MRWLALLLLLAGDYTGEVRAWRDRRESALRAPEGWLSVAGLFWLSEGTNAFPNVPATFELRAGQVTARVNGHPRVLRPDTADSVSAGGVKLFAIRRGDRVGIRLKDPNSSFRREFTGLKWYAVSPGYRVTARFVPEPRKIPVQNVIGQTELMDSPGYVTFRLNGRQLRLRPVRQGSGLFFLFRDLTSGHETYGAGRFLDTAAPRDGTVELDFNKAYNPPCAFTPYATCPLPPRENRLPVRVEAGERAYGNH
ncbi:MAG: DUF1684 domain-containing protein [Bryobacteraceae bacterium]